MKGDIHHYQISLWVKKDTLLRLRNEMHAFAKDKERSKDMDMF